MAAPGAAPVPGQPTREVHDYSNVDLTGFEAIFYEHWGPDPASAIDTASGRALRVLAEHLSVDAAALLADRLRGLEATEVERRYFDSWADRVEQIGDVFD